MESPSSSCATDKHVVCRLETLNQNLTYRRNNLQLEKCYYKMVQNHIKGKYKVTLYVHLVE